MKKFVFEIEMKVADMWIEDGFGAHSMKDRKRFHEQIEDALREQLMTSAYSHEFRVVVKTISAPSFDVIKKLQGYPVKTIKSRKK